MDRYLVLDTDAASRLQKTALPTKDAGVLVNRIPCLTFVTVGEFYKGAHKQGWGQRRMHELTQWLRNFLVLPYDEEVARIWGRLSAEAELRGRPLPANDAWIAACCLSRNLPLLTYNRRHFDPIDGLRLLPEEGAP